MRRKDREVTDLGMIKEMIDRAPICRIAMFDEEYPYLVPLNFGYELADGVLTLYFHSANEGKKLDLMRKNPHVCFEIEGSHAFVPGETPCQSTSKFFSIIGRGEVTFVTEEAEKKAALGKIITHADPQMNPENMEQKYIDAITVYKIVTTAYSAKSNL